MFVFVGGVVTCSSDLHIEFREDSREAAWIDSAFWSFLIY